MNIRDWHKSIEVEATRSTWTALTSDARKARGLAPSFWIADEVAQWRSRELWDNLKTGMAKRRNALAHIGRYSAVPIRLADPSMGPTRLSGRFRLDTPEKSAALIGALVDLEPKRQGGAIVLGAPKES